jgi:hypothetical protein
MQVRPGRSYSGAVTTTRFDPIANTPGSIDFVQRATQRGPDIIGRVRNSVVGRGHGTYNAGPVESFREPYWVPSVPRRNYIPTVARVELD